MQSDDISGPKSLSLPQPPFVQDEIHCCFTFAILLFVISSEGCNDANVMAVSSVAHVVFRLFDIASTTCDGIILQSADVMARKRGIRANTSNAFTVEDESEETCIQPLPRSSCVGSPMLILSLSVTYSRMLLLILTSDDDVIFSENRIRLLRDTDGSIKNASMLQIAAAAAVMNDSAFVITVEVSNQ